jgi:hypothetical protein
MNKIINETKDLIETSLEKGKKSLYDYSREQVINDLTESGLSIDDFGEEELKQMIAEQYKKNESFGKGVAAGAGVLMFLNLLG